jgi:hypothetical protein
MKKHNEPQTGITISVPRANVHLVFAELEKNCSFTIKLQRSIKTKSVKIEIHSTDPAIVAAVHGIAKKHSN